MNHTQLTVLITGGATGIGFAIAEKFHAAGNRVILVGRTEATLSSAVGALPGAEACVADITLTQDRDRLLTQFPDISVLVNNAGFTIFAPIASTAPEDIELEIRINLVAPVLLSRAYLPLLLKQPTAAIVNVSSGLALVPQEISAIYSASKAALHSFSRTLRWQLENTNVRVFEVIPPLVDTATTAGRGKGKISPAQVAEEFWEGFKGNRYEMLIGNTKLLPIINRLSPSIAEKMVRHGP